MRRAGNERRNAASSSRQPRFLILSQRLLASVLTILFVGICVMNVYLVSYNLPHPSDHEEMMSPATFPGGGKASLHRPSASKMAMTVRTIEKTMARNSSTLATSTVAMSGEQKIIQHFRNAHVKLKSEDLRRLPTWDQIENLFGNHEVVLGLDRCEEFRKNVPPLERMLGAAGMFNSGTNLVTRLMKENCVIPERKEFYGEKATKEMYGIRWQVPWGKHTPAMFKYNHTAPKNEMVNKDSCLPIVTIRNPYNWMSSMCRVSYTARWQHRICPHLVDSKSGNPIQVDVKLAEQWLNFTSLAHLWNDWYAQYERDASYPFVIVRFEDLIFRQYETTKSLCNCAGGVVPSEKTFKFIVNSAKIGPGHGSDRTGMLDAWIKYGKPMDAKAGFSDVDFRASIDFLSKSLMQKLGYKYPPEQ